MNIFEVQNQITGDKFQFLNESEAQQFMNGNQNFVVQSLVIADISQTSQYSIEDIWNVALKCQRQEIDEMGAIYLSNALIRLELKGGAETNSPLHLPYKMIKAIEKWTQKIWARYDFYKLNLKDGVLIESIDFSEVGQPPCSLKDVQFVIDSDYRLREPARVVNTDVNYYNTYLAS